MRPLNERLATYKYVVRANGDWVDELYPSQVGHVAPAIGGARLLTQPAGLHTGHSGDLMGMVGGTRKDKGGM